MAQYSVNRKAHYHAGNSDVHEVVMTADKDGNIINSAGASSNINISAGLVEGWGHINKFGFNPSIGSGSWETIYDGSNKYTYLTVAGVAAIASTNPADSGKTVEVQGLDENYNLVLEDVVIGTSSQTTFIRIFRMIFKDGTTTTNIGAITATVGGAVKATILAGAGQTLMALYTVPAGKTAYLLKVHFNVTKNTDIEFRLVVKPFEGAFNVKGQFGTFGVPIEYNYPVPLRFEEKTDIELEALGGNTCAAGGLFDLILVDNEV
jgi:hypothetical protein